MTSPEPSSYGEIAARHIGIGDADRARMLAEVGYRTLSEFIDAAGPNGIRSTSDVNLPAVATEAEARAELHELARRNTVAVPMIGLGYHPTITPAVIRRNVLEAPAWYTAYTPYQPEISQGRLEALIKYWPPIGRIDQAHGDRNLVCTCPSLEPYES
jgi:glycine dehydrogenase